MILVTGGTGFIGSHLLLHLLENDEKVRAIYRNSKSISKTKNLFSLYAKASLFDKIEWIEADVTDIPSLEIAFRDIEFVYHCAALVSFDPKDEARLRKINIEGTANIVNFSLQYDVKKLCYVSSIAALGDLPEYESAITETTEWNPEQYHSDYAISKYGAEMEVWRAQQEGLDVVIINPGVVLGAGFFDSGSGELFNAIATGLKFYSKGNTGFVGIADVVAIAYVLMKSDFNAERFILVSETISFEEITNKIATALNVKPPYIDAKKWMSEVAWRFDWMFSNLFFRKRKLSKAMATAMQSTDFYSNEKIKNAIIFEFTPIDEVIKTTVAFFKIKANF